MVPERQTDGLSTTDGSEIQSTTHESRAVLGAAPMTLQALLTHPYAVPMVVNILLTLQRHWAAFKLLDRASAPGI